MLHSSGTLFSTNCLSRVSIKVRAIWAAGSGMLTALLLDDFEFAELILPQRLENGRGDGSLASLPPLELM